MLKFNRMKRIFIAVNLPEGIKTELGNLQKEIAGLFPEDYSEEKSRGVIKWVLPKNLHITLLFIGYVREERLSDVCRIVEGIAKEQKPFSLRINKVCYGPPRVMPPRLIWVDLEKNRDTAEISERLADKMLEAGILREKETRPFSPHITLGRINGWQWKQIEPEERPEIDREISLQFEVKSIEVMESILKRTGAEYVILKSMKIQ